MYTFQGGMRAVVWTDVFQALVMFGGMLAILIQVCSFVFLFFFLKKILLFSQTIDLNTVGLLYIYG